MKIFQIILLFTCICFAQKTDSTKQWNPESIRLQNQAMMLLFDNISNRSEFIDSALCMLDKSYKMDTTYYQALVSKIGLYQEKKDYSSAIKTMQKVLLIKPDHAEVAMGLAMQYDFLNQQSNAKKYYKLAIKLFQNRIETGKFNEAYNNMHIGLCLIYLGKEDEGKKLILKYESDPETKDTIEILKTTGFKKVNLLKSMFN